jgi:transcriptional regulator with XRE-family HTH domain
MRGREVNADVLSKLVQRRLSQSTNLREAAKEAGVSPATLSRVQRGHVPDTDALAAIARWLKVPIDQLLSEPPPVDWPKTEGTTMQKVEVHLRADPKLSPEAASRLADVYKMLYEEFVSQNRTDSTAG